jgi:predicted ATP-grasp superfamily ATP-dependent carboligase
MQDPGRLEYRFSGTIGPLPPTSDQSTQLAAIAQILKKDFSARGIVGVDLIDSGDSLVPIEINPRPTASCELLERFIGTSLIGMHCAAFGWPGTRWDSQPLSGFNESPELYGKSIVYWHGADEFVVNQQRFDLFCELKSKRTLADIPRLNLKISSGQPIATVFATAATPQAVLRRLVDHSQYVIGL